MPEKLDPHDPEDLARLREMEEERMIAFLNVCEAIAPAVKIFAVGALVFAAVVAACWICSRF